MEENIIEYGRFGETYQKAKLDIRDKKILAMLSQNARTPLSAIAKNVRLSRDSIDYRIKRMEKLGVILKFTPIIDLTRFGYNTYHLVLVVSEKNIERRREFIDFLKKHPNTKSIMEYSGRWDIEWVLVAKDIYEFDKLITDVETQFSDLIEEKNRIEIIKGYKSIYLPQKLYHEIDFELKEEIKKPEEFKLGDKDLKILQLLSEDSRKSTYEIGNKISLSSDAVSYKIKKMYAAEVIRQFTVVVNLTTLGYNWYTLAVNLKTFDSKDEAKLKEYIKKHPYIIRVVKILGNWDLLISIAADSLGEFHKTVKNFQETFGNVIANYQTWIAYKEHMFEILPSVIKG